MGREGGGGEISYNQGWLYVYCWDVPPSLLPSKTTWRNCAISETQFACLCVFLRLFPVSFPSGGGGGHLAARRQEGQEGRRQSETLAPVNSSSFLASYPGRWSDFDVVDPQLLPAWILRCLETDSVWDPSVKVEVPALRWTLHRVGDFLRVGHHVQQNLGPEKAI